MGVKIKIMIMVITFEILSGSIAIEINFKKMAKYCTGESSPLEWTEIEKGHTAPHSPIEAFFKYFFYKKSNPAF